MERNEDMLKLKLRMEMLIFMSKSEKKDFMKETTIINNKIKVLQNVIWAQLFLDILFIILMFLLFIKDLI
jgi:hypothetical protein